MAREQKVAKHPDSNVSRKHGGGLALKTLDCGKRSDLKNLKTAAMSSMSPVRVLPWNSGGASSGLKGQIVRTRHARDGE